MLIEVWDSQGPRCYLDVTSPPPMYLGRLSWQPMCYHPLSQPAAIQLSSLTNAESFQLHAIRNDEARTIEPVYLKLTAQGVPCPT